MKAKFAGRCKSCGGYIDVGDEVKWLGKGRGVRHADEATCDELADMRAEQAAEMLAEAWGEARLMGTTSSFWDNYG